MRYRRKKTFSQDGTGRLDALQLERLERAFRDWAASSKRPSTRESRNRILLIFLLIRYTGAKLSEVLELRFTEDVDCAGKVLFFARKTIQEREVHISMNLASELAELLPPSKQAGEKPFAVDPAFVRRKFYERAQECGFDKEWGGPEMIRKARAAELVSSNLPLPAVQRLLGHSSPNLTAAYVSFSDKELCTLTQRHMERESSRKTSARNSFFGKITALHTGDIQTLVEMLTLGGDSIRAMVTNASAEELSLGLGRMLAAEVKAPWIVLEQRDRPGTASAENRLTGVIGNVLTGAINTECTVRLADGTELCAILSTVGFTATGLAVGDPVRVLFNCYAVVLHIE